MKNATTKSQHTPGEWKRRTAAKILVENKERDFKRDIIVDKIGVVAISVGSSLTECEANSQRIVKAVKMLSQIEKDIKALDYTKKGRKYDFENDIKCHYLKQLLKQAE